MSGRTRPAWEAPGGDPHAPRLLLVSDQFPPAASAGALRWQKLAGYAAARGWALDVVTRDFESLGTRDEARLRELPPGTRIFTFRPAPHPLDRLEDEVASAAAGLRRRRREAAGPDRVPGTAAPARPAERSLPYESVRWEWASPRFWMRAYWGWLDHRRQLHWARQIARLGRRVLPGRRHRLVVSCGPWHLCNHEAARRLAQEFALPLVLDLRDPWSLPRRIAESIASPVWFALAARHEARAVRAASLVVVNAVPVERAMRTRYPAQADRFLTVTNGCDGEPVPPAMPDERFTIAYTGGIYLDRDPRPVFRAAARLIAAERLTPAEFGIELMGNVDDYGGVPIRVMAEQEGIAGYVRTTPPRPRQEALALMARAHVLLSLPQDSPWAIPSKIFEYMQFEAWLLVLADPGAPAAELLRDTEADVVAPDDVPALERAMAHRLAQHRRGERPPCLGRAARFQRAFQAERLMAALAPIMEPGRPVGTGTAAPAPDEALTGRGAP